MLWGLHVNSYTPEKPTLNLCYIKEGRIPENIFHYLNKLLSYEQPGELCAKCSEVKGKRFGRTKREEKEAVGA